MAESQAGGLLHLEEPHTGSLASQLQGKSTSFAAAVLVCVPIVSVPILCLYLLVLMFPFYVSILLCFNLLVLSFPFSRVSMSWFSCFHFPMPAELPDGSEVHAGSQLTRDPPYLVLLPPPEHPAVPHGASLRQLRLPLGRATPTASGRRPPESCDRDRSWTGWFGFSVSP